MGPAISITSSPGDCHAHWSLGTTGLEYLALRLVWRQQVFSGLLLNTSWHESDRVGPQPPVPLELYLL